MQTPSTEMQTSVDRTATARILLIEAGAGDAALALARGPSDPAVAALGAVGEAVRAAGVGAALDRLARGEAFDAALLSVAGAADAAPGLDAVRAVAAAAPDLPVLLIHDDDGDGEAALRAVQAGAHDVLARSQNGDRGERLGQALRFAIERQRRHRDLARRALRDPLTGVANRDLFRDRLADAAARGAREGRPLALVYLDLDGFKRVNDALGHAAGDRVLADVAGRLVRAVRRTDTVARLGGDEFGALLEGLARAEDAAVGARKLLDALARRPFAIDGHRVGITASAGIALYPADTERPDELPTLADTAMYRAKEVGPGRYKFYTADMNTRARERLVRERALRRALERGEFRLLFQPQVAPASGRLRGAEALLRWRWPRGRGRGGGEVGPEAFVPLAEETGLIGPLGEWTLRRACAQLRAWGNDPGLPAVPLVAVNLSPVQLRQAGLRATAAAILDESGVEPGRLELELMERLPLDAVAPDAAARLAELKGLGLRIAIDDFGNGAFSLGHLRRGLPLDAVKLDGSLVRGLGAGTGDALVGGLIDLAHALGLEVVAEGVETEAQLAFLRARGCDAVQGHLISPPLEADAFAAWLRARDAAALPAG